MQASVNCGTGKITYEDVVLAPTPTPAPLVSDVAELKAALIKKGVIAQADIDLAMAVQTG